MVVVVVVVVVALLSSPLLFFTVMAAATVTTVGSFRSLLYSYVYYIYACVVHTSTSFLFIL